MVLGFCVSHYLLPILPSFLPSCHSTFSLPLSLFAPSLHPFFPLSFPPFLLPSLPPFFPSSFSPSFFPSSLSPSSFPPSLPPSSFPPSFLLFVVLLPSLPSSLPPFLPLFYPPPPLFPPFLLPSFLPPSFPPSLPLLMFYFPKRLPVLADTVLYFPALSSRSFPANRAFSFTIAHYRLSACELGFSSVEFYFTHSSSCRCHFFFTQKQLLVVFSPFPGSKRKKSPQYSALFYPKFETLKLVKEKS